jgi:malic enzyme
VIAPANNALVFAGLGVTISRVRRITDPMSAAAADAVARLPDATTPGSALLPPVDDLRAGWLAGPKAVAAIMLGCPRTVTVRALASRGVPSGRRACGKWGRVARRRRCLLGM